MKLFIILALALCAHAADMKEKEDKAAPAQNKDKRQTQDDVVAGHYVYRTARKQEQVAPVEENQEDEKISRDSEEYRPGQVFSLNARELLELQPERKAPLGSDQLLQQLYSPSQQEHKQNLQQVYYLEPQQARQVQLQPSHAVIARPSYTSNGGEASVGAALSVSDTGASPQPFDQELLALLQVRPEEPRQAYSQSQPIQQTSAPNLASQHQQIDRYITKPTKKTTKLRSKVISSSTASTAPQQYLIETTNVQQQQLQQQQIQQQQIQQQQIQQQQIQQQYQQQQPLQQYRQAPQPQRPVQSLRYVPFQQSQAPQQVYYERPETQGLKVVPAPKLQQLQQQPRAQIAYRILPQYQQPQPEATPKQYRIVETPRPQLRQEQRLQSASVERPVSYLKRYPEPEKMRAVKIYEQVDLPAPPQPAQVIGEQYFLRPIYRQNEQRARFDLPVPLRQAEQRPIEATKAPSSAIYVSKNLAPKKLRPQPVQQQQRLEQQPLDANIEQQSQSIEEQRAHLPPPRNNKAYTPEEFAALVAAGYSVTPVPVSALSSHTAQSRSSIEPAPAQFQRRPVYRRPQYLPIRDDAP